MSSAGKIKFKTKNIVFQVFLSYMKTISSHTVTSNESAILYFGNNDHYPLNKTLSNKITSKLF